MAATTMIHVRVDEHIKAQATETLAAMGLSVSDAVRQVLPEGLGAVVSGRKVRHAPAQGGHVAADRQRWPARA